MEEKPKETKTSGSKGILKSATKTMANTVANTVANTANTVRFSDVLDNEYKGLANGAIAPFIMPLEQLPGEGGKVYPSLVTESAWDSVDHYVAAMKFPDSPEHQLAIQQASSAAEAKKMGVNRSFPVRTDWESIRNRVVKSALLAKFRQNPDLRSLLLNTHDKRLLYAVPDSYWGEGSITQDKIAKGEIGKGNNILGNLLQEVRSELSASETIPEEETKISFEYDGQDENESTTEPEEGILERAMDMVSAVTGMGSTSESAESESNAESNAGSNTESSTVAKEEVQSGGSIEKMSSGNGNPMYFLLQPQFGIETKAVRGRDRGSGRNIRWNGMNSMNSMSSMNSMNAGPPVDMTSATEMSGDKEITVQKLG